MTRYGLVFLIWLTSISYAAAQDWDPFSLESGCPDEVTRFCEAEHESPGAPGTQREARNSALYACLSKHEALLSPGCWDHLKYWPVADLRTLSPRSVPGFAALGNLGLLPASVPTLSYGGWITTAPVPVDVVQNRLTVQLPVYHDDLNQVSVTAGAAWLHFGQPEQFAASSTPVPTDLWKFDFGAAYSRKLENERLIGGSLNFGSASDTPFSDFDVTTRGISAYYSWASGEHSRWMITLLFSNNNPIIDYLPIPGFVYLYQTRTLIAMLGVPFSSVVWMPREPWTFTLSAFGPVINSEIAYGSPRGLQFFTGYSWLQQSYLQQNRVTPKDRLYYNEMHIPFGARMPVSRFAKAELALGYAFDRSVYVGPHLGSTVDGLASLGDSLYISWSLRMML